MKLLPQDADKSIRKCHFYSHLREDKTSCENVIKFGFYDDGQFIGSTFRNIQKKSKMRILEKKKKTFDFEGKNNFGVEN